MSKLPVFAGETPVPYHPPTRVSFAVSQAFIYLTSLGATSLTIEVLGPEEVEIRDTSGALPPTRVSTRKATKFRKPSGRVPFSGWYGRNAIRHLADVPRAPALRARHVAFVQVDGEGREIYVAERPESKELGDIAMNCTKLFQPETLHPRAAAVFMFMNDRRTKTVEPVALKPAELFDRSAAEPSPEEAPPARVRRKFF